MSHIANSLPTYGEKKLYKILMFFFSSCAFALRYVMIGKDEIFCTSVQVQKSCSKN